MLHSGAVKQMEKQTMAKLYTAIPLDVTLHWSFINNWKYKESFIECTECKYVEVYQWIVST